MVASHKENKMNEIHSWQKDNERQSDESVSQTIFNDNVGDGRMLKMTGDKKKIASCKSGFQTRNFKESMKRVHHDGSLPHAPFFARLRIYFCFSSVEDE